MKKNTVIVSIHQPNLFPWLGYFQKIIRSDDFILLDHVVNNPRDSLWTKRVQIILNKNPFWLTIPLKRPEKLSFQQINKMRISESLKSDNHLKTIIQNYKNAPYFEEVYPLIETFYFDKSPYIAERNIKFIKTVCKVMGIKTEFYRSSEMSPQSSASNLLVDLIKKVNGSEYIYGGMGESYQENKKFSKADIKLIPQNFKHPLYSQMNTNEFVDGLSIIDAAMNIGFDRVKSLLVNSINRRE